MGLGSCVNLGSKLPCSLLAGLNGAQGSAFSCPSRVFPASSSMGATRDAPEPLIEQSRVSLEGHFGHSRALWKGNSRRHPQFELGESPQPLSCTQAWECAASLGSLVLHPSLESHGEWTGDPKRPSKQLEQLNPCSATSYFYLPHQHLGSHSKSALAAFAALPRAPRQVLAPAATMARGCG